MGVFYNNFELVGQTFLGVHVVSIVVQNQRSHNLGKFPQIVAVSMGVALGIMRILCIPFKILLFG